VLQGPSGEPITSNGLTLEEVLFRFRHPNPGVRRDAIGAAKEILVQQPSKEVGKVCRVMGGAISDEVSLVIGHSNDG
jgi:pre-rRNA-processing protein IPI1